MKAELLLMPRIEVLQDYPDSDYLVGQEISFTTKSTAYTGTLEWQTDWTKYKNAHEEKANPKANT